jgi:hypothetical protein
VMYEHPLIFPQRSSTDGPSYHDHLSGSPISSVICLASSFLRHLDSKISRPDGRPTVAAIRRIVIDSGPAKS